MQKAKAEWAKKTAPQGSLKPGAGECGLVFLFLFGVWMGSKGLRRWMGCGGESSVSRLGLLGWEARRKKKGKDISRFVGEATRAGLTRLTEQR